MALSAPFCSIDFPPHFFTWSPNVSDSNGLSFPLYCSEAEYVAKPQFALCLSTYYPTDSPRLLKLRRFLGYLARAFDAFLYGPFELLKYSHF